MRLDGFEKLFVKISFCISALNESTRDQCEKQQKTAVEPGITKEAQESEAIALYNESLLYRQRGSLSLARQTLLQLLQLPFIERDCGKVSHEEGAASSSIQLRYSVLKNLAEIADNDKQWDVALEYYMMAVETDSSDVSVWYKIGKLAMSISNYSLARHAFEMGLEVNPRHWPCLDNVITLFYVLNNCEACLQHIAVALERDPCYVKGIVLREKIFSDYPYLQMWAVELFQKCESVMCVADIDEEESCKVARCTQAGGSCSPGVASSDSTKCLLAGGSIIGILSVLRIQYIDEVLTMRRQRREQTIQQDLLPFNVSQPISPMSWKSLGGVLLNVYHSLTSSSQTNNEHSSTLSSRVCFENCELDGPVIEHCSVVPDEGNNLDEGVSHAQTATEVAANSVALPLTVLETGVMDSNVLTVTPKRGRKRKNLVDDLQSSCGDSSKRRSTRAKGCVNTVKTKEESIINFRDLLQPFLPASLSSSLTSSHCSDKVNNEQSSDKVAPSSVLERFDAEADDVKAFLVKHANTSNIINLLTAYLVELSRRDHCYWPDGLSDVYMAAYRKLRKHVVYPNYLSNDESQARIQNMARMCLVELELVFDKWRHTQGMPVSMTSPNSPRRSPCVSAVAIETINRHFLDDLRYITGLCSIGDVFTQEFTQEFCIRVSWLHARYGASHNDVNVAVFFFDQILEQLDSMQDNGRSSCIVLPNCQLDNSVSTASVTLLLDSIRKCQSLDEVYKLSKAGDHQRVVSLLLPFFNDRKSLDVTHTDRSEQLLLLMDSLIKINDLQTAFTCGESFFNEILKKSTLNSAKDNSKTIIQMLNKLCCCVNADDLIVLSQLSPYVQTRLTNNVIRLIEMVMDQSGTAVSSSLLTASTWILLFKLIQCAERLKSEDQSSNDEEDNLSQSLKLLMAAHEHLGSLSCGLFRRVKYEYKIKVTKVANTKRGLSSLFLAEIVRDLVNRLLFLPLKRGWCMMEQGRLLLFTVDVLSKELSKWSTDEPHPNKDDIDAVLAQCFYCLYGHPNKRARAKHLEDHNVNAISLSWENCQTIFDFFKPKTLPEYDSYKTSAVSAELESLLRRIALLIPPICIEGIGIETLTSYIEGSTSNPPCTSNANDSLVKEIHYLLADYYFKTKEMTKATKYYMLDLCMNPERFDSWAGMALARASRLETKLSAHELRPDIAIQRPAASALRCFQRALELDGSNVKLWIEYGSCAYLQHSHASRLLKRVHLSEMCSSSLSRELIQQATTNYTGMLKLAENCFKMASVAGSLCDVESEVTSEKWLLHYMLGKIAEKLKDSPRVFLDHYQQAACSLHDDKAKYPRKINYYTASYLAVESLEIYYRLHVCIIKYLLQNETDMHSIPFDIFQPYVEQCLTAPFVLCAEKDKRAEKKSEVLDSDENSVPAVVTERVVRNTRSKGLPDHTYSRQKNSVASLLNADDQHSVGALCMDSAFTLQQQNELRQSDSQDCEQKQSDSVDRDLRSSNSQECESRQSSSQECDFKLSNGQEYDLRQTSSQECKLRRLDGREFESRQSSSQEFEIKLFNSQECELRQSDSQECELMQSGTQEFDLNQDSKLTKLNSPADLDVNLSEKGLLSDDMRFSANESVTCAENKSKLFFLADTEGAIIKNEVALMEPSESENVNASRAESSKTAPCYEAASTIIDEAVQCVHSPAEISTIGDYDSSKEFGDVSLHETQPPSEQFVGVGFHETQGSSEQLAADGMHDPQPQGEQLAADGMHEQQPIGEQLAVVEVHNTAVRSELSANVNLVETAAQTKKFIEGESLMDIVDGIKLETEIVESSTAGGAVDKAEMHETCQTVSAESEGSTSLKVINEAISTVSDDVIPVKNTSEAVTKKSDDIISARNVNEDVSAESYEVKYRSLLNQCIKALELCLGRFPQHYKSIYRLSDIYIRSHQFKNIDYSRELLLGNPQQQTSNLPCSGLFQERKQTNFFQGLWRIPSAEIDRAGSFASHLARAVQLLFNVLKESGDHRLLFSIHKQLIPTPEVGKKYLRDADRVMLSHMAYGYCLDCLEQEASRLSSMDANAQFDVLMQTCNVCQHGSRIQLHVDRATMLLTAAFHTYTGLKEKVQSIPTSSLLSHSASVSNSKVASSSATSGPMAIATAAASGGRVAAVSDPVAGGLVRVTEASSRLASCGLVSMDCSSYEIPQSTEPRPTHQPQSFITSSHYLTQGDRRATYGSIDSAKLMSSGSSKPVDKLATDGSIDSMKSKNDRSYGKSHEIQNKSPRALNFDSSASINQNAPERSVIQCKLSLEETYNMVMSMRAGLDNVDSDYSDPCDDDIIVLSSSDGDC